MKSSGAASAGGRMRKTSPSEHPLASSPSKPRTLLSTAKKQPRWKPSRLLSSAPALSKSTRTDVEERLYMAVDTDDEKGAMFGPFLTASNAEKQARMLGWKWVLVYVNTVENGKVVGVKTRFYQLDNYNGLEEDPMSVEAIRKKLVPAV